jgi:hypothetical protein
MPGESADKDERDISALLDGDGESNHTTKLRLPAKLYTWKLANMQMRNKKRSLSLTLLLSPI